MSLCSTIFILDIIFIGNQTPGGSTPSGFTPGGSTPSGFTPGGITPSGTTPTGAKAMAMATPTPGHLMSMTPEQLQAYTWQREIDERNRPLSDDELDSLFPPGYKVCIIPSKFNMLEQLLCVLRNYGSMKTIHHGFHWPQLPMKLYSHEHVTQNLVMS